MKNELTEYSADAELNENAPNRSPPSPRLIALGKKTGLAEAERESARSHRIYWGKIAPKYEGFIDTMIGTQARAEVLARFARAQPLGRVVEFGCGTGYNTTALAANATAVVATDLAPGMLVLARQAVQKRNVSFRVADCRRTLFGAGQFDTAVLGLVLHFARPETTLNEMHRIVRPGGRLFIVNPGLESLGRLARLGCRCRMLYQGITRYRLKPPADFAHHLVPGRELGGLLERVGWRLVRLETIPSSSRLFGLPLEFIEAVRRPERELFSHWRAA